MDLFFGVVAIIGAVASAGISIYGWMNAGKDNDWMGMKAIGGLFSCFIFICFAVGIFVGI